MINIKKYNFILIVMIYDLLTLNSVKKIASVAVVSLISVSQIAPTVQAQSLWELENSTNSQSQKINVISVNSEKTDGEVLADAFLNTFDANFTAKILSNISANGLDIDWSGVETEYIIDAKADNVEIKKTDNAFSYIADNANVSFSINSDEEEYANFFPFKGFVNWSEQGVLNFDTFQFALKTKLNTLEIDNDHIKNLIGGFLELYELFENKWIALDFVELEKEFPELKDFLTEIKDDLYYELNIDDVYDFVNYLAIGIDYTVENGSLIIAKSENVYTLTSPDSDIVLTIALNSNKTISLISVKGNERWVNEWSDFEDESKEYSDVTVDVSVSFTYQNPRISFPIIEKKDFDITNFYKMYLEIEQSEIVTEQKENQFYLNLNKFNGDAEDAIDFLTKGENTENKLDSIFVRNYVEHAKNLDRRIRLSDLSELSVYGLDEWDINYLYDDIKYNENKNISENCVDPYIKRSNDENLCDTSYGDRYDEKYVLETLLELFDINNNIHYINWDTFEKLDYSLKTRGDILILLAKIRKAEKLQK